MPLEGAQKQAVEEQGAQLVLAGPGSGKTTRIVEKISQLIKQGVQPKNILALTFSNKAVSEMSQRLEEEDIDPSGITVSTFHSFCLNILKENPFECGISPSSNVITKAHQLVWGLRNVDSFHFQHIMLGSNAAKAIESIIDGISTFRDEFLSPKDLEAYLVVQENEPPANEAQYLNNRKYWDLLNVWKAYERYKQELQLLDHDDMHIEAVRLLKENPTILDRYRRQYTHFFVDEFQDTNFVQLCLIKQLAGKHLCVVGDSDQSIYQFRRAYPTNFQDFKAHFAPLETPLEEDYRNSNNILQCALQLLRKASKKAEKSLWTSNEDGEPVVVSRCENEDAEAAYVVDEIQKLTGQTISAKNGARSELLQYKDIAVLSRRRDQGAKVYKLLRKRGIPAEFLGEVNFFASAVIRTAMAYLKFANEPLLSGPSLCLILKSLGIHETNIKRINAYAKANKAVEGIDDGVYESMRDAANYLPSQGLQIEEIAHMLGRALDAKRRIPLLELVDEIVKKHSGLYQENIAQGSFENIKQLNTFVGVVEEYASIAGSSSIADLLEYIGLLGQFEVQSDELEERNSVKVMTAHQSKGTQFSAVFVIDLAKNRFPSRFQKKAFTVPSELVRSIQPEEQPEGLYVQEERRLLYVAMTRAKHRLYLTYSRRYGTNIDETAPSQFLLDLDFERNPRIKLADIPAEEVQELAGHVSPLEREKKKIQGQISTAAHQMRLKSAFQGLIDLERIRLVEDGGSLDDFGVEAFVDKAYRSDEWLRQILSGEPPSLIGKDHHFSPTSLDTYNTCPLNYKFEYVLKVPAVKKPFILGSFVHGVIHYLALEELRGLPVTEFRALEAIKKFWPAPRVFKSKTEEAELQGEARKALEKYVAWNEANENEIVGSEVDFLFSINGRKIKGRMDRIERTSNGEYIVIDFKTASSGETSSTIPQNIQLNVYCLAMQQKAGLLPKKASLVYLKGRTKPVHYYPDQTQMQFQEARLKGLIDNVIKEQFDPAIPSPYNTCRNCGYTAECTAFATI
jgi:DNA helicase-2/ATP-dependent DNA helicase PcrA